MKRAARIGLAMTLLTINASLFTPAMAQGLLSDIVRDTLDATAGVVGGAAGIVGGVVNSAANIVTGTVDAAGNVIDVSGNTVGRVVVGPTSTAVVPGWTVVSPGVTTTTTTSLPTTTTSTTRVYTFGAAPVVYGSTLDVRIADLRNAITNAEATGKLTATQAAAMRTDLDRIVSAYNTAKAANANSLTFEGALAVARDLDTFNTRLATTLNVRPFRELVVTTSGTPRLLVSSAVLPGATTLPGAVATTTGNAVGGLVSGLGNLVGGTVGSVIGAAGSLVGGAAGTVIGTAGNLVNGTVTTTGEVIDASGRVIGTVMPGGLGTVSSTPVTGSSRLIVGTTTDVLGTNIDLRIADMRRVLGDMTLSGRLTPAQVATMTASLDTLQSRLITDRASGRTLSFDEAMAIARDLDAAANTFGTYLGTNPWRPMVLVQAGSPSMMIITRNGVVNAPVPGTTLGTTLGTTTVATSTVPGTTVVSTAVPSPQSVLAILDARRYDLDRLITNALNNRTITATEAARWSSDLNRIALGITQAQSLGAGFTTDNAITLARSLDDFNVKLATALHLNALPALTFVDTTTAVPRLVADQFTNVVALPSVDSTIWLNTLSARRAELESMIATGVSGGQLTAQQAAELRAELNRIATLESAAARSGVSFVSALPLAMNLDVLGNRIRTFVPSVNFTPLISQGRISFVGGPVGLIDEVSLRRAELAASVDRELALGRLTATEATRLRTDLALVQSREGRYRADGVLTFREATLLNTDLNRIAARLNALIANRRGTVSVVTP